MFSYIGGLGWQFKGWGALGVPTRKTGVKIAYKINDNPK